jgi:hypothetical protein
LREAGPSRLNWFPKKCSLPSAQVGGGAGRVGIQIGVGGHVSSHTWIRVRASCSHHGISTPCVALCRHGCAVVCICQ